MCLVDSSNRELVLLEIVVRFPILCLNVSLPNHEMRVELICSWEKRDLSMVLKGELQVWA